MLDTIIEIKKCKTCWSKFDITDKDLKFYNKISPVFVWKKYQILPPTNCPDCRQKRRLSRTNENKLYKRTCDASGKSIVSIYSPDKPYKIYDQKMWRSDSRDAMEYWQDFDFYKNFFVQFDDLLKKVPIQNLNNIDSENSDYCSLWWYNKNCYLIIGNHSENCFYWTYTNNSIDCVDYFFSLSNQNCYEIIDAFQNNNVFYSQDVESCNNSYFLYSCKNCINCFGCVNLINKEYYIYNKPYTQKEYSEFIKEHKFDYNNIQSTKVKFKEFKSSFPRIFSKQVNCELSSWDNISNVKNTKFCFDSNWLKTPIEDCAFVSLVTSIKDSYDIRDWWNNSRLCYELISCTWSNILFSELVLDSNNIYYSKACFGSSNLFGCIGLRNKEYCILNKQYNREEYESLIPKIIEHMQKTDERWEWLPYSISPFGYNETLAQEYFPISKEVALARWYKWMNQEYPINIPENAQTLKAQDLPNNVLSVSDDILSKVIICEVSWKPFRIVKSELEFYRKHNLPVPRKHPDVRHMERLSLRNPRKLWDRECMKCWVSIQTTYAPDRLEIVYCQQCYNKAIYW